MTDKKRKTVTTVETHEVWIIRKAVPVPAYEASTITPMDIAPRATAVSSSSELNSSETSKEQDHEESSIPPYRQAKA